MAAVRLCALVLLAALTGGAGAAARGTPCPFPCKRRPPLTPAEARDQAAKAQHRWLYEIRTRGKRARSNPHPVHFPNPTKAAFRVALRKAGTRYHFRVLRVRLYKPFQLAPLVIVQSAHPLKFSRNTPAVQRLLDPRRRAADDRQGWRWEGFYLEGRDSNGVPFLAIFNFWRGGSAGGGEWARSEELYPYPHL
jgi:hypothetical protein